MNQVNVKVDVLVIGAGLAGLMAAYEAAYAGLEVGILSKNGMASTHVIGFSAPVADNDSPESFTKDIIAAGQRINDPVLARILAEKAADFMPKLEALGMQFDQDENGYALMRSLGHSSARLVHHGNTTGPDIMKILETKLKERNASFWPGYQAIKIFQHENKVCGVAAFNKSKDELLIISAKSVVLATGGGHIAARSTYAEDLTCDGFALAYEAGAKLSDMEFIQHEPMRCVGKKIGMSTTMLVHNGKLLNKAGERFVCRTYASEAEPTKDELSRLLALEIKSGRGGIFVDLTEAPEKSVIQHKAIYKKFTNAGIDLRTERVEIAPAAHTIMGGICIGEKANTNVEGLFAAGEVIGELHGASRLGGNAGTEVLVFGEIAGKSAADYAKDKCFEDFSRDVRQLQRHLEKLFAMPCMPSQLRILRERALKLMTEEMGPVRDEQGLKKCLDGLELLSRALSQSGVNNGEMLVSYIETANLLLVCRMACIAAMNRKESRGSHYRLDYPETDDLNWKKHIRFSMRNGMEIYDGGVK